MKVWVVMFEDDVGIDSVWGVYSTLEKAIEQQRVRFIDNGWILEHELDR